MKYLRLLQFNRNSHKGYVRLTEELSPPSQPPRTSIPAVAKQTDEDPIKIKKANGIRILLEVAQSARVSWKKITGQNPKNASRKKEPGMHCEKKHNKFDENNRLSGIIVNSAKTPSRKVISERKRGAKSGINVNAAKTPSRKVISEEKGGAKSGIIVNSAKTPSRKVISEGKRGAKSRIMVNSAKTPSRKVISEGKRAAKSRIMVNSAKTPSRKIISEEKRGANSSKIKPQKAKRRRQCDGCSSYYIPVKEKTKKKPDANTLKITSKKEKIREQAAICAKRKKHMQIGLMNMIVDKLKPGTLRLDPCSLAEVRDRLEMMRIELAAVNEWITRLMLAALYKNNYNGAIGEIRKRCECDSGGVCPSFVDGQVGG